MESDYRNCISFVKYNMCIFGILEYFFVRFGFTLLKLCKGYMITFQLYW